MKLQELLENKEYYNTYHNIIDDLSVQDLAMEIKRYRAEGMDWQEIYDHIEQLELSGEAQANLTNDERQALFYVLRDKEGR